MPIPLNRQPISHSVMCLVSNLNQKKLHSGNIYPSIYLIIQSEMNLKIGAINSMWKYLLLLKLFCHVQFDTLQNAYFPCLLGHPVDVIMDFKIDFWLQGRTEIIAGVMGGVLLVSMVITLSVYRKWKVEQASSSFIFECFFLNAILEKRKTQVGSKADNLE